MKKPTPKRILLFVLLGVGAVVLVAWAALVVTGLGMRIDQRMKQKELAELREKILPIAKEQLNEIFKSEWQTYKNDRLAISFQYPPAWTVEEGLFDEKSGLQQIQLLPPASIQKALPVKMIFGKIIYPKELGLEELALEQKKYLHGSTIRHYQLDGLAAAEVRLENASYHVFIAHPSRRNTFFTLYFMPDAGNDQNRLDYEPVFRKISKSFRFTPSP